MRCNKRMKTEVPRTGPELPHEIVTEVLLRLPVKSVLRFRAVCPSWAATLSSDEFCSLHMARADAAAAAASAQPRLLLVAPTTAACDATAVYSSSCSPPGGRARGRADLMFTLDDVRGDFVDGIAAQCRGLTLLYDAVAPAYYVVNAATRAVTRLPPCQDVMHSSAGLGFDARTKEYKVMGLLRKPKDPDVSCEVYALGGAQWRPAAGRVPSRRFSVTAECAILAAATSNLPPVLANGSLHWLIDDRFLVMGPAAAIITFSVTEETFGWIESPPPCGKLVGVHLVELGGCLCMVKDLRLSSSDWSNGFEIWKLQDYTSGSWSLHTRIDLPVCLFEPRVIRVIGALGDGRSVQRIILATSGHTVHAYDAVSKNIETILSLADTAVSYPSERDAIRICLFRETLAPVRRTREETSSSSPVAKAMKEVLIRLPARSVVQSKLVCSEWRRFIEDRSFIRSYSAYKSMDKRIKIVLVGKQGTANTRTPFHFAPLDKWRLSVAAANNKDAWLDSKLVCSKPCHGLNLLITAKMDYLYNPCTGYRKTKSYPGSFACCAPWETPADVQRMRMPDDHAFAIGNKNVGLGFNQLNQEHVAVIMLYQFKDLRSREYRLTCSLWHCRAGYFQEGLVPPLPVNNMPPAYLSGALYWMSDPTLGPSSEHAILSFDIAREVFDVISCPPHVAKCSASSQSARRLFVVELEEMLCVVVADLGADELVVWRHAGAWRLG